MRVISQNGTVDVHYETSSLFVYFMQCVDPERAVIYCKNSCFKENEIIAEYSTKAKAIKAMEMLREAYIGMPIVMQNVDVPEDVVKEFKKLKKCGVMIRADNQPPKIEFINNSIFQFPQDDEIEVFE